MFVCVMHIPGSLGGKSSQKIVLKCETFKYYLNRSLDSYIKDYKMNTFVDILVKQLFVKVAALILSIILEWFDCFICTIFNQKNNHFDMLYNKFDSCL